MYVRAYTYDFNSTALVDKIYQAQKERDTAVNARLRLAKDEKEDLLARMRRLEKEQAGYAIEVQYNNNFDEKLILIMEIIMLKIKML
jgi:hypothetical protein